MSFANPFLLGLILAIAFTILQDQTTTANSRNCDRSYPDICIAPPPPDLDCKDIKYRNFRVLPPDPHHFDGDNDGIGCEKRG